MIGIGVRRIFSIIAKYRTADQKTLQRFKFCGKRARKSFRYADRKELRYKSILRKERIMLPPNKKFALAEKDQEAS